MKNEIFSWGSGAYGQLGNNTESIFESTPVKVNLSTKHNPVSIYAKYYNSFFFDSLGDLFAWGRTQSGSLGKSMLGINLAMPIYFQYQNLLKSKISSISVNKEHGGLVTEDGKAYTWGVDYNGRLGQLKEKSKVSKPTGPDSNPLSHIYFHEVYIPDNLKNITLFKQIACGSTFTLLLSNEGEVFSFGSYKEGCLGNKISSYNDKSSVINFSKITFFEENQIKIKKIEAGNLFACALSYENQLYCWGKNDYGQLGIGEGIGIYKQELPSKVSIEEDIEDFTVGEDHAALITKSKSGYIWGYGLDGRLCSGQMLNSHYPIKIDIENINKIALGGQHTAILTESKELYLCGNGIHGELGRGNKLESSTNYKSKPVLVDYFKDIKREIIDVSCGRNHTLVLTKVYI